jgi:thiamine biosynthesis lipoprotein
VSDSAIASTIIKNTPKAKLDFNAIAQGIAVDVLAELIESKGGKNYFVEIGGEIRVNGRNKDGNYWNIGIDKPLENSTANDRVIYEIVSLENKSIATSGSYRKFYEEDGLKYSHTLDPKTGYPVTHNLLSASVIADNCGLADALATAIMVMGPDKGMDFVNAHPELNIEVYLIFNNSKDRLETYYTEGFKEMVVEN